MKSLKIFLKKSSCGCTAKTRKGKSKRKSKRKNYRGGYKALNMVNAEKISLSGSIHRRNSPSKGKKSKSKSKSNSN